MARVYGDEPVVLDRVLGPAERGFSASSARAPTPSRTGAATRARCSLFSAASLVVLLLILSTQSIHPWNPLGLGAVPWDLSFNTAASFVTNTNWQFYGGETTMTNFTQMAGLAVQNFVSAAVGIAVLIAVVRGFAAARRLGHRQLLVRPHAHDPLRPAADLRDRRPVPRLAGRRPDALGRRDVQDARRRIADPRPRPGRLAGVHQGARDERRRLLQRQRRDAVREPARRSRTSSLCSRSSSSRRGSRPRSAAWSAAAARAGRSTSR